MIIHNDELHEPRQNHPNIGGRFSALSFFGMVSAGFLGIDLNKLVIRAIEMSRKDEIGPLLGTILGIFSSEGKNKVTFFLPEEEKWFNNIKKKEPFLRWNPIQ